MQVAVAARRVMVEVYIAVGTGVPAVFFDSKDTVSELPDETYYIKQGGIRHAGYDSGVN